MRKIIVVSSLITTIVYWDLFLRKESLLKKQFVWLSVSLCKTGEKEIEEQKIKERKRLEEQKELEEKRKIIEQMKIEERQKIAEGERQEEQKQVEEKEIEKPNKLEKKQEIEGQSKSIPMIKVDNNQQSESEELIYLFRQVLKLNKSTNCMNGHAEKKEMILSLGGSDQSQSSMDKRITKIAPLSDFLSNSLIFEYENGPCLKTSKSTQKVEWFQAKFTFREKVFNEVSANSLNLIHCLIDRVDAVQDILALKCTMDEIKANDVFVQSSKIYAFIESGNTIWAQNCESLGGLSAEISITVINCDSVQSIHCKKRCKIQNSTIQGNVYSGGTPDIKCTRIEGTLLCPTHGINKTSPSMLFLEYVQANTVILNLPHRDNNGKQRLILSNSQVKKVVFQGEKGIVYKDENSHVKKIYGGKLGAL